MSGLPSVVDVSVVWSPLLPWPWLLGLGALAAAFCLVGVWQRAAGSGWRLLPLALLLLVLANPQAIEEKRTPVPDTAVVLIDDSPSQQIAQRPQQTDAAVKALTEQLAQDPSLETRVVRLSQMAQGPAAGQGTRLFSALERAVADIPRQRLAGAILITDGQVHDLPNPAAFPAPVHALLTGSPHETDRRVVVESAPAFGLVGAQVSLSLRLDDPSLPAGSTLPLTLRSGQHETLVVPVQANASVKVSVPLSQAGLNVIDASVPSRPGEPSEINNHAVVSINGVRDRLRVLLISGEPHIGERAWRSLLKADPNVDLVHFTILRLPQKEDRTPLSEMSLIPFPIRELFEERLSSFDLVIFDRYSQLGLIPLNYLGNVTNYVRDGGAVMLAVGPEYSGATSLYRTPLADILPAAPDGMAVEQSFVPQAPAAAARHPITAPLLASRQNWGPWLRRVPAEVQHGTVLLTAEDSAPLLVVDRVGKGRVGLLLSDTAWLWGKGWQGGGPQQELIRRLSHWLMAEPDLEENALDAHVIPGRIPPEIAVTRRALAEDNNHPELTITAPDGQESRIALAFPSGDDPAGFPQAHFPAPQVGGWTITDGTLKTMVAVASADPVEDAVVVASEAPLAPLISATHGGSFWLSEGSAAAPLPALRRPSAQASSFAGSHWLGLRRNGESILQGISQSSVLPGPLAIALILTGLFIAWWREGK